MSVTDIKILKYSTDGKISYKLNYSDEEFTELRKPRNSSDTFSESVPVSYIKPLQIKGSKFRYLQQIIEVIPKDYHAYYDQLPNTDN